MQSTLIDHPEMYCPLHGWQPLVETGEWCRALECESCWAEETRHCRSCGALPGESCQPLHRHKYVHVARKRQ